MNVVEWHIVFVVRNYEKCPTEGSVAHISLDAVLAFFFCLFVFLLTVFSPKFEITNCAS